MVGNPYLGITSELLVILSEPTESANRVYQVERGVFGTPSTAGHLGIICRHMRRALQSEAVP